METKFEIMKGKKSKIMEELIKKYLPEKRTIRIGIDVGGVLSKYPNIFRPILMAIGSQLRGPGYTPVEVHVISDMHPKEKIIQILGMNYFGFIANENVHSADYANHGERCKKILCEELGIDILIDDFIGYVATGKHIRLLVMPNPDQSYYHDDWKTDGTEGNFGRRSKKINNLKD